MINAENQKRIEIAVLIEKWFDCYGKVGQPQPFGTAREEQAEWQCRKAEAWRGLQNVSRKLAKWIRRNDPRFDPNDPRLDPTALIDLSNTRDTFGVMLSDSDDTLKAARGICQRLQMIVGQSDEAVRDATVEAICRDAEPLPAAKGVTLIDAALVVNDGDKNAAREARDRWRKLRSPKLPDPTGRDPKHSQAYLYEPAAIVAFIKKVETIDKARVLQALLDVARPVKPL